MATVYISAGRRRRRRAMLTVVASGVVAAVLVGRSLLPAAPAAGLDDPLPGHGAQLGHRAQPGHGALPGYGALAWPGDGAAAVAVDAGPVVTSGGATPVPIASLAKVMTAQIVLRTHPLTAAGDGLRVTITADDVRDTAERRAQGQSVVAGEQLTERQALLALLLPSANNIAIALARAVSGSTAAFVDRMNQEARRLGMARTTYTDPSGFEPSTVSTARDQVVLARAAMRISAFRDIVGQAWATLPVAGVVLNTDTLVGRDGFVGIKTGSDQAAGGCFLFARVTGSGQRRTMVYGVVLGQRHGPLIAASLQAARRLAASAMP